MRVARGKEAEKQQEQEPGETTGWEQAAANLPLETGYSLVTGTGRAEIEFEDASVVYLARQLGADVQRAEHDKRRSVPPRSRFCRARRP